MTAKKIIWTHGDKFLPRLPFPEAAQTPEATCQDERYAPDWGSTERCGLPRGHADTRHASFMSQDRASLYGFPRPPALMWLRSADTSVCITCGSQIQYRDDLGEWTAFVAADIARTGFTNVCDVPGGHRPTMFGFPYRGAFDW